LRIADGKSGAHSAGHNLAEPDLTMRSMCLVHVFAFGSILLPSCSTPALSPGAARVTVTRNPAPTSCSTVAYLVGEGGGTFGGAWISNDHLIEYAMNDLRNKAAERGANYVQSDAPQLGSGKGTTTTVTITGTAYRCASTD
jgi:hypothetical protein